MLARSYGARCGMTRLPLHNLNSGLKSPLVKLRGAAVTLGGHRVLDAIDWTLLPGESWAIFGANGSGKTTFLRLIAGLQWPVPGSRNQRSYDFGEGPENHAVFARRHIRLVGPELHDRYHRFNWNLKGRALIATGFFDSPILRFQPDDRQTQAIQDLADRLQIHSLLERRFLELSRGEQRKLLLARAVISTPRILLLDEICDGLDQSARDQLLGFIDELSETGVQLVFATHRRHEIPQSVGKYCHLQGGHISESGPLASLRDSAAVDVTVAARPDSQGRIASANGESTLIAITNADLYRGDKPVVTALNWNLRGGQNWLIRGDNGSGKSTVIKLLHADIRPALGGRISWFGMHSPVNVWELRQRLGLVSDELQSSYSDAVTVYQCVATGFFASIGRVPFLDAQHKRSIAEWLDILGLDGFASLNIHQLSYGQFRRVLIARALVQRPDALLLDEPMSGMDGGSTALIWSLLEHLSDEGTRIVMASHEVEIAGELFTHQLMLEDGCATAKSLI